jgi:hypothetical protein
MKINLLALPLVTLLLLIVAISFSFNSKRQKDDINGAWQRHDAGTEHLLLFMDGYFSYSTFNKANKRFFQTRGGTYQRKNEQITITIEFDTQDKDKVGKSETFSSSIKGNRLIADIEGRKEWKRIDDGSAPLAGVWHITERMQEGKLVPIHQTGPRKTLKILTGSRFQWAAINPETKEFFGTGGGTYIFANGKYTEQIDFFSRDSSRVGASLQFNGELKNGEWHHSGLSSKGDKIYEVWSRVKK